MASPSSSSSSPRETTNLPDILNEHYQSLNDLDRLFHSYQLLNDKNFLNHFQSVNGLIHHESRFATPAVLHLASYCNSHPSCNKPSQLIALSKHPDLSLRYHQTFALLAKFIDSIPDQNSCFLQFGNLQVYYSGKQSLSIQYLTDLSSPLTLLSPSIPDLLIFSQLTFFQTKGFYHDFSFFNEASTLAHFITKQFISHGIPNLKANLSVPTLEFNHSGPITRQSSFNPYHLNSKHSVLAYSLSQIIHDMIPPFISMPSFNPSDYINGPLFIRAFEFKLSSNVTLPAYEYIIDFKLSLSPIYRQPNLDSSSNSAPTSANSCISDPFINALRSLPNELKDIILYYVISDPYILSFDKLIEVTSPSDFKRFPCVIYSHPKLSNPCNNLSQIYLKFDCYIIIPQYTRCNVSFYSCPASFGKPFVDIGHYVLPLSPNNSVKDYQQFTSILPPRGLY